MSEKKLHGFDGMWSPKHRGYANLKTFSLGVFEILKTKDGLRTKRGKVKVRVHGRPSDLDNTYAVARAIADKLDAGTYDGPKSIKAWLYKL